MLRAFFFLASVLIAISAAPAPQFDGASAKNIYASIIGAFGQFGGVFDLAEGAGGAQGAQGPQGGQGDQERQ